MCIVKKLMFSRVISIATLGDDNDHPLTSTRQKYTVRILLKQSTRDISHLLPPFTFKRKVTPFVAVVPKITVPNNTRPVQFEPLNIKFRCRIFQVI